MSYDGFDIRQGIVFTQYSDDRVPYGEYRLIVKKTEDGIDTVPVYRLDSYSRLYNISDNNDDKHNVLLQDCPPPFTYSGNAEVYAVANMKQTMFIPFSKFDEYDVQTSDNHASISDRDWYLVQNHDLAQTSRQFTRQESLSNNSNNLSINRELPWDDESLCSSNDIDFDLLGR